MIKQWLLILKKTRINNKMFTRIKNYTKLARLNQPTGIWLLFLPCLFSIALVVKNLPNPDWNEIIKIISLFGLGSFLMRSAGCIINDLFDQKLDQQVFRTKSRPLSSKKVSFEEALLILGIFLLLSLSILLQLNTQTVLSGFLIVPFIILYPLTKRITNFPQIFLGLTFNFGVIMASLALIEEVGIGTLILYFICILWTLLYDTVYAFQDIEDDLKVGAKSSAIVFAKKPQKNLFALCGLFYIGFLTLGIKEDFCPYYYAIISLSIFLILQNIKNCNFDIPKECLLFFKNNLWFGLLFLIAIIVG